MAVPRGLIATALRLTVTVALVAAFAAPVAAIPDWLKDPSYGEPVDLSKRRNLEQPITLEREDITVADFFQWLEDEHEIRLKTEEPALTKHLAIFVKERPAWEVLEAVAGSMHAEWRLYLTNLWLRLSHAPDDLDGMGRTFMDLLGPEGMGANEVPETGDSTVDLKFAAFARALEGAQAKCLLDGEQVDLTALSPQASQSLLEAIRESVASDAYARVRMTTSSQSPVLWADLPGAIYAAWIEWDGHDFRLSEQMQRAGGGAGWSGYHAHLKEDLGLLPGDGAQDLLERQWMRLIQTDPETAGATLNRKFRAKFETVRTIARERGYLSDAPLNEMKLRRKPGLDLAHVSTSESLARQFLDPLLFERLTLPMPNLPKAVELAKECRALADQLTLNVIAYNPDARRSRTAVLGSKSGLASIQDLNEAFGGAWYASHQVIYFAPSLPARPLHQLVQSVLAAYEEYSPRSWRQAATTLPQPAASGQEKQGLGGTSLWELLVDRLTPSQRRLLRSDVLFWQDLEPSQRQAVMTEVWQAYLRSVVQPLSPEIRRRFELITHSDSLEGTLTYSEDSSGQVTLHFQGTPFDYNYTLPPGILAHLMKLKQQADAEEKAGTSAPPPH